MTLEEQVRGQIGAEGPQMTSDEFEDYVDEKLRDMPAGELLARISDAMEARI